MFGNTTADDVRAFVTLAVVWIACCAVVGWAITDPAAYFAALESMLIAGALIIPLIGFAALAMAPLMAVGIPLLALLLVLPKDSPA